MKNSIMKATPILFSILLVMLVATPAWSDQVILDDLIVNFSQCIGQDCVNGEDLDVDTLRLKENNLRIHFQDTSNTAGFPSNDWRIKINDPTNGGANYFAVEDSYTGFVPFRIEAGSAHNLLYLDDTNRVGIGTDTPLEKFHVVGNALITGNLELGSSQDYKFDIRDLDDGEALDTAMALRPVKYFHEQMPDEEVLGFIAEEVPALVATNSRKSIGNSDITAVLTKVIQQQQLAIEDLTRRLEALESK